MRYLEVAEHLRSLIAAGGYGAGGSLPSEADLGARFGVSRVTVRRALEHLRADGLVTSRRGSGWFAAVDPLRQALGRFTTVEAALEAAGVAWQREVIEFSFEPAGPAAADALGLDPDDEVLRVRRRNRAGGDPFAVVTVWVSGELGASIARADAEKHTFYELLGRAGRDVASAIQTITAEVAVSGDQRDLGVAPGSPMLVCERVTADAAGAPVLYSQHRYPAHRMAFEVELPRVAPTGEGPVGLRLVEGSSAASGQ